MNNIADLENILLKLAKKAVQQYHDLHSLDIKKNQFTDVDLSTGLGLNTTIDYILELDDYISKPFSPRYFGLVTGGITPAAFAADWLVSLYDQNLILSTSDSISTKIELAAVEMLSEVLGLKGYVGKFTTGATSSNVNGLLCGRQYISELQGYNAANDGTKPMKILSAAPHSSIFKAASIVGLGHSSILSISGERPDQIDLELFDSLIAKNPNSIVVITFGEVNTGSLPKLETVIHVRMMCDKYGCWLHIDGAFGLFSVLVNPTLVEGLLLADSITGDCHKYLNVPYDCGVFYVKSNLKKYLIRSLGTTAAYLDSNAGLDTTHGQDFTIENSQRFRALPVFATLKAYGKIGYVDLLTRTCEFAKHMALWIQASANWEILADCEFCIVLFRSRKPEHQTQAGNVALVRSLNATGKVYFTPTVWMGKPSIRCAVVNWATSIEQDWETVKSVLSEIHEEE
ncbi:hypothetical protein HK103_003617 [Boothiomyces macroporosus]|uniref:Aspartate aminotransferase family protein n=1 Tax=Boothiomyces macroporosus TaxID=261099 RepID=A0AAD5UHT9_9FUNG|nr:hypothetical protein HK103_003617 [Boothiomyces macroporosus]